METKVTEQLISIRKPSPSSPLKNLNPYHYKLYPGQRKQRKGIDDENLYGRRHFTQNIRKGES
ncbi:hypothetical protein NECAME_12572 [Necator americanus]|uniref:Uncharacterized protein n=1 Tax=Necator americanus TaxID=51031 RepID=W2T193_NECAM|nr:hypothetical protein NECAME_12572 [Necator americanus]ETN75021.1 hypothetical protein NECAME_12572 [Necator americanus]